MFHTASKTLAAIVLALGITVLPATSFAEDAITQATTTEAQVTEKDKTIRDIRNDTEDKVFEARAWLKEQKAPQDIKYLMGDMEKATDRLQDKVAPVGQSIKSFAGESLPGTRLVKSGDKTFTFFGILLMMAFGFVLLMLNLANPESRVGGRH